MLEVIILLLGISLGQWWSNPRWLSGCSLPGEPRTQLAPRRATSPAGGADPGSWSPLSCVARGTFVPQPLHHPPRRSLRGSPRGGETGDVGRHPTRDVGAQASPESTLCGNGTVLSTGGDITRHMGTGRASTEHPLAASILRQTRGKVSPTPPHPTSAEVPAPVEKPLGLLKQSAPKPTPKPHLLLRSGAAGRAARSSRHERIVPHRRSGPDGRNKVSDMPVTTELKKTIRVLLSVRRHPREGSGGLVKFMCQL